MSIPLHLVNGFLGSGKTTFLLQYLHTFGPQRKIGVIQNEFSAAGIDGKLVERQGNAYQILEINNGSVFCVCLLGGFISALSSFIDDYNLDEIIMEASGMSDPVSIGQIFQAAQLRSKVYLGYCWTIVDAQNFHKVQAIRSRVEHQIRIADTVIVNKCDLAGHEIDALLTIVKKINPFARVLQSTFARIDLGEEKNQFKFFPVFETRESPRPDLLSLVIKSNRIITVERLNEFVASAKGDFIRFKGFANINNGQKYAIQGVFDDYTLNQVAWFPGPTEMVGIGTLKNNVNYLDKFDTYCSS